MIAKTVRTRRSTIVVLCLYVLTAFGLFGHLVARHFTSWWLGSNADSVSFLWWLAWWPYALGHGIHAVITKFVWAPTGENLMWTTSIPVLSVLFWPLTQVFGPVASFNTITLLDMVLAPFGMYLILKRFFKNTFASVIGGYIYGYSSYELAQQTLGHINLTTIAPMAFMILIGAQLFEEKVNNGPTLRRWMLGGALTLMLVFQFLISEEIYAALALFSGMFAFVTSIVQPAGWAVIKKVIPAFVAPWIASGICLVPVLVEMRHKIPFHHPPSDPYYFGIDVLNFIIPTAISLGGQHLISLTQNFSGDLAEWGGYMGLPMIVFLVASSVNNWFRDRWMKVCAINLGIVVLLSMGDVVRLDGIPLFPGAWRLFSWVPLIKDLLPSRFMLFGFIYASIIVAKGLSDLKLPPKHLKRLVLGMLIIVPILPNALGVPSLWLTNPPVPAFFRKSSTYKKYIARNSVGLIFPYYINGNEMGAQIATKFYFRNASGYLGPVPLPWAKNWLVEEMAATGWPPAKSDATIVKRFAALLASQEVQWVATTTFPPQSFVSIMRDVGYANEIHRGGIYLFRPLPALKHEGI